MYKLIAKRQAPKPKQLKEFSNPGGINCQCEQCTLHKFGYIMYVIKLNVTGPDSVTKMLANMFDLHMQKEWTRQRMWLRESYLYNRYLMYGTWPVIKSPNSIIYPGI